MWRILGWVSLQTLFLAGGQVMLKLGMQHIGKFEWTWAYIKTVLLEWRLMACGVSFGISGLLWLYILKKFPFSQAYPLTSLSFVFGMFAAWAVFDESITFSRWIGLILVLLGCFLIMK